MITSLIKLKFQERWFILETLFKLRKNVQNGLSSNLIVLVESEINNTPEKLFCYWLSIKQQIASRVANQITAFALVC